MDEVVGALLGRGGPPAASTAAGPIKTAMPSLAKALEGWPYTCPFCEQDKDQLGARCLSCNAAGCTACVTGKGCPPCAAKDKERREQAGRDAEEMRARADRLVMPDAPPDTSRSS